MKCVPCSSVSRETRSPYTMTSCQVRANTTLFKYQYICHAFNNYLSNFEQKEATVLTFLIADEVVYHNAGAL